MQLVQQAEYLGTIVRVEEVQTGKCIARRVHVTLNDRGMRAERKAFHYSIGDVRMDIHLVRKGMGVLAGAGAATKDFLKSKMSQESFIKPHIQGRGEVYLEMTWSYLYILQMTRQDKVTIEAGCWHASDHHIEVDMEVETNVKTGLLGGGFVSTRLAGEGWVVVKLPVPFSEIHRISLNQSKTNISEGSIVFLTRGDITHRVKRAAKSLIGSKATGEGLVQVYSGTGELWYVYLFFVSLFLSLSFLCFSLSSLSWFYFILFY